MRARADTRGGVAMLRAVYLLYWCKGTNTDAMRLRARAQIQVGGERCCESYGAAAARRLCRRHTPAAVRVRRAQQFALELSVCLVATRALSKTKPRRPRRSSCATTSSKLNLRAVSTLSSSKQFALELSVCLVATSPQVVAHLLQESLTPR
jgi:hypothetical protein